jgi:hypothetical protein
MQKSCPKYVQVASNSLKIHSKVRMPGLPAAQNFVGASSLPLVGNVRFAPLCSKSKPLICLTHLEWKIEK